MLRVTAVELPARWMAARSARNDVHALLAAGPETDLVLLPEASFTGYVSPRGDFDLRALAEPLDGPTARALARLAAKHRVNLAGPLIEREGKRFYNSLLVFDREGMRVAHYRKRHPWIPEHWATPGPAPLPEIVIDGVVVTAAICYDLHFLEEESADALQRADVLLFASAWVAGSVADDDEDSREVRLRGLAARYNLAVVNANWGAGVPALAGQGGSMIIAPGGEVAARTPATSRGATRLDVRLFE